MLKQYNHVGTIKNTITIEFTNGYSLTLEAGNEVAVSVVEDIISNKKTSIDKENVKKLFKDTLESVLVESGAFFDPVDISDKNDLDKFTEEYIITNGGWDSFYKEVETGISNGIPVETQFELMKKILCNYYKLKEL